MDKVLYLSEEDMIRNNLLNMNQCIKAIEDMFLLMKKKEYVMSGENNNSHGSRISFDIGAERNIFIGMEGYLGGEYQKCGLKFHGPNRKVEGNVNETNHTFLLSDAKSGRLDAILTGNSMTTFRTAAVSAYATLRMIKNEPKVIGIIGPGKINLEYTRWLVKKYKTIEKIKIKGRSNSGITFFIDCMKKEGLRNIEFVICDDVETAVRDSDIISIITGFEFNSVADMPFIRERWIKNSAIILCPSFVKFTDKFLLNRAIPVVDNYAMYESYANELGRPAYKFLSNLGNQLIDLVLDGKCDKDKIIEISNFQKTNGYIRSENPVTFSSGGMILEDIAISYWIVKNAVKKQIGTKLNF